MTFSPRTRLITLIVMGVAAAALIGWDVVVASNRERGDTISEITQRFVYSHPLAFVSILLWLGILIGHLFWPQFIERP